MRLHQLSCVGLVLGALAVGCAGPSHFRVVDPASKGATGPRAATMFFPPPLNDDWSRWIVGDWEGAGESPSGKGRGRASFALALGGQFLISRGEAQITELDPVYLKQHLGATDAEIERFRRSGYQSLEIYTVDPKTGEVSGFLFDSLRCLATGRGTREGFRETVEWEWRTGHRSTRITERLGPDKMRITERTPNPDGSVMEDKGELVRCRAVPGQALP